MNEKIEFSVIIPTYNRAAVLGRALESVTSQSLPALEIIVVDDGSTDNTRQLVHECFPGVSYHFQTNQGVSKARNQGVRFSRGNWLAFLDSDDQWLPDKLRRQCQMLQSRPDYKLCHSDETWIRNGKRVNPMRKHAKSGGYIFNKCLSLCAISPSAAIISRQLFEDCGGFDESLPACEDYDLWLRLCAANEVLYLDEPLVKKFGGHSDQLSRQYWGMDRFRVAAIEKLIASGKLSREQHIAAVSTLIKKSEILASGALKRSNYERAQFYNELISKHRVQDGKASVIGRNTRCIVRGNHEGG